MKTYTHNELCEILRLHNLWVNNIDGGVRARLSEANLSEANLSEADLRGANLRRANLRGANLRGADLRGADLSEANLRGADLSEANLRGANLRGADLSEADLRGANLRRANLRGADLRGADLRGADLSEADLRGANLKLPIACPEEGSFIGFKKLKFDNFDYIVKLEIPSEAKRCSATSRKCRCEYAKVLSITGLDGSSTDIKSITNITYKACTYEVGQIVYPDSFDEDRWNECSHGIHFFITRQEAVDY